MKIVSVVNSKGGVGKSVVTRMLGCGLMAMGYKVAIMDADSQATCLEWSRNAIAMGLGDYTPVVARVSGLRNRQDAQTMFAGMDVVLVDTIGTNFGEGAKVIGGAIRDADFALIPLNPASVDDVTAVAATEQMAETALMLDPNKVIRYVFTRMNSRKTNFEKHRALAFAEQAAAKNIGTLSTVMYMRDQYSQALALGTSPLSLGEKEPARLEVEELAAEVAELLGLPVKEIEGAVVNG